MTPIPDFIKENIIAKLKTVDLTKVNGYTLGIKFFLTNSEKRTDSDYLDLIKSLQAYCKTNADQCILVLGNEAFIYFNVENLIAMEVMKDISRKLTSYFSSFSGIRVIPNFKVGSKMQNVSTFGEPFEGFADHRKHRNDLNYGLIMEAELKYKAVLKDLNDFLSTLKPADDNFNLKSVNQSIEKVHKGLLDLRNIACSGA